MSVTGRPIKINLRRELPGNRREVFRLLYAIDQLVEEIDFLKEIKIVESEKGCSKTNWKVDVDGLPICWLQKTWVDEESKKIMFASEKGDLQTFSGCWLVDEVDAKNSLVDLSLEVVLGIPFFDEVVKEELEKRVTKMFSDMLYIFEEKLLDIRYDGHETQSKTDGFAVMGHPYNFRHLMAMFKVLKPDAEEISEEFLKKMFELAPSYKAFDVNGFKSKTGTTIDGCFVMCPIIPDMAVLTPDIVLPKVLAGCRIAERYGAGVLALGGFTSIVGERFLSVLKEKVKMPITTGNTFTVAMTLAGVRKAAQLMGVDIAKSKVAIIGGTGDIGSACSRVLNLEAKDIVITGRTLSTLGQLKDELTTSAGREAQVSTDNHQAVKDADIIIAAASSTGPVVDIEQIKSGAIVCDVGYPKNISYHSKYREDILVFSGGLCRVPSAFDIGVDVGLPSPDVLYGCWAEAIILSLEQRFENFSEGKGMITVENVQWIAEAAEKHGFTVSPFYWGMRVLSDDDVRNVAIKSKVA